MGIGDEIIASGHALSEYHKHGKRVVITDIMDRPRWSEMWEGLHYIVEPQELGLLKLNKQQGNFVYIKNGGKARPYIQYPFTVELGCTYSGWRCNDHIGMIALTSHEMAFAAKALELADGGGPIALVEPNLTSKANPNKQWGFDNWQELAYLADAKGISIVQCKYPGARMLDSVFWIETSDFRHAAAVLNYCDSAVLPEGGLHHAAGALRKNGVIVLFGGSVDYKVMGYDSSTRLFAPAHCGKWLPCRHCAEYWKTLKPQYVLDVLCTELAW